MEILPIFVQYTEIVFVIVRWKLILISQFLSIYIKIYQFFFATLEIVRIKRYAAYAMKNFWFEAIIWTGI